MPICTSTYATGEQHRAPTAPEDWYRRAGALSRGAAIAAALLGMAALYCALTAAPGLIAQGRHNLIVFIHVPSGWMSILIYVATAAAVLAGRSSRHRMATMCASALAPTGALFAFLSLWTGSLWMKPNWGVWWIWEPRQVSQLLLLLLFLGFIGVQEAMASRRRADRACAAVVTVGMFVVPVLFFAVRWWSARRGTLELGLMVERTPGGAMVWGLIAMTLAMLAYGLAAVLTRLRIVILERERDSQWVAQYFGER